MAQRPAARPARRSMSELATALTEEDLAAGEAPAQPFGPEDALSRHDISLKQALAAAEERARAAEAALEAARAGGDVSPPTGNEVVSQELERTKEALAAALADLEHQRGLVARAEAEGALSEFRYIDPERIEDNLPGDRFDFAYAEADLAELAADIEKRRQDSPILVRPKSGFPFGERFEIAAGKRRLAACRLLGIPVLARVRDLNDEAMLAARFGENHHRRDLSPFERAQYYAGSLERTGLTVGELASIYGVGRTVIQHHLALMRIPRPVIRAFRDPAAVSHRAAKRLLDALEKDPTGGDRVIAALDRLAEVRGRGDAGVADLDEVSVALSAALRREPAIPRRRGEGSRPIYLGRRKIATASQSGGRWQLRFDPEVDDNFIERLTERLPELLEEIAREARAASKAAA
ncbi:ParB/RepB/Spo0J family partition protein [Paracraurococcus lichenis]|uniref:ParB/RepB/Spo0J family partition protein n=1 Tax=Paracraurococcus lichenis TaxID=3064888 RepID=A0ABT9ECG9_9PROT|nr:ParB/RepB/Spo0J family partition protein [Paracraurococcus sp. LOR1-02]MDO9713832.1 ParB/RepB/Spo0J family partition protein [Paracraurococcus sp. LOR1-02]